MSGLDEFELIARFFTRELPADSGVELGIGDDAAVVACGNRMAIAVDTLVEAVHFPAGHPARSVGHRALAVNVSDIAAMGLAPRWFTLALTLPDADADWLEAFAGGMFALAGQYGLALVGGDTTRGPLTITVQVMADAGVGPVLSRTGARPGDGIYVTGTLGDAAAVWSRAAEPLPAVLAARFGYPTPRVAVGTAMRELASAAIDVSDGLLADLGHVCGGSGCGARLVVETLPVSPELVATVGIGRAQQFALTGGDDYELCLTVPPANEPMLDRIVAATGTPLTRIGTCVERPGIEILAHGEPQPVPPPGYRHF
jgi:thiamine-monophosphate kinase